MADTDFDLLVFGRRLRHLRRARGLTLEGLGALVGRPAPYLSQLETGKREPRLSLVSSLAEALGTTTGDLITADAPSRRTQLEIALERAQRDPLYQSLGLPYLKPSARLPDNALEHLVGLYRQLARHNEVEATSPEGARHANAALRADMRRRDNYFGDIEAVARAALEAVGWTGRRALSDRTLLDLAQHFGFTIHRAASLPANTRSITDLRHRTIYIRQRTAMPTREARSVILQTLGHFALDHGEPMDFAQYLHQRVEANYFAGAVLAPEQAVVDFLVEAKAAHDIAVDDIEEVFAISYEMAAHRFTNLATTHLGLHVHFLRSDEEGVIWKAYENDGVPFPADSSGAIEGQRACRHWGARRAFHNDETLDTHCQYTETDAGCFWAATSIGTDLPLHGITVGVPERDARWFRGSQTKDRQRSACPNGLCCRTPSAELAGRWAGLAWPSSGQHSHVLATFPVGAFPGVDLTDVYEFLDHQAEGPAPGR